MRANSYAEGANRNPDRRVERRSLFRESDTMTLLTSLRRLLAVANTGDRPIQVGSHYHFFETNEALRFDRPAARGFRLDIPAGTAVRFEPGQSREVRLVRMAGSATIYGFQGKVMGQL